MTRPLIVLARGHGLIIAAGVYAIALSSVAMFRSAIPLPQALSAVEVHGRFSLFAAFAMASGTLVATREPLREVAETSPRNWRHLRAIRLGLQTITASFTLALAVPSDGLYAAGVTLTFIGEGLLGARFIGDELAWLLPLAHLAAAAVVGTNAMGEPSLWAWIIEPAWAPNIAAVGASLATLGIMAWSGRRERGLRR